MAEDFNPADNSLVSAMPNMSAAAEILKAKDLDDWLAKLDFSDTEEATNFALTINKCLNYPDKDVCQAMAQEVLRVAKSRCSAKARRVNKFGEIVMGMMKARHEDNDDRRNR